MDLEDIMLRKKKSDRERQIPYDFTCMWNLKNKINERNKLIDTENISMVAKWEGGGGMREMGRE